MPDTPGRTRQAFIFLLDISGIRWLQDDFLTACLSYLLIAVALVALALVIYVAATR